MSGPRRPTIVTFIAALVLGLVVAAFMYGGDNPQSAANRFMSALAKGDVSKLTSTSFMDGDSAADVTKKWEYATKVASPHYIFVWRPVSFQQNSPESASVKIELVRNADSPASYPELFGIPLVKKDGQWLVDVRALDRKIYPNLPR